MAITNILCCTSRYLCCTIQSKPNFNKNQTIVQQGNSSKGLRCRLGCLLHYLVIPLHTKSWDGICILYARILFIKYPVAPDCFDSICPAPYCLYSFCPSPYCRSGAACSCSVSTVPARRRGRTFYRKTKRQKLDKTLVLFKMKAKKSLIYKPIYWKTNKTTN